MQSSRSFAMASVFISCPTPLLTCISRGTSTRKIVLQKRLYSTKRTIMAVSTSEPIVRRSATYPPSLWPYDYLQSLTSNYVGEKYEKRSYSLKDSVRIMISKDIEVEDALSTLQLIDDLQRLGISYHFENEISGVLNMIYHDHFKTQEKWDKWDLRLKSLGFRLLRQNGYPVSKDIFNDIKDEAGDFKACLCDDTVGMLNLYEASFLAVDDESILEEAKDFTTKCLRKHLEENDGINESMSALISHSLQLPLRWRTQRSEAAWFIDAYERRIGMNPMLLELAKLDFNMVQAIYQEDLKHLSRWWEGLGWDKKLPFARGQVGVLSFLWAIGSSYKPQSRLLRENIAKSISLITTLDDVYDLYGTVDELERFTDITERWDVNAIEELPDYMKICFLGFYNSVNELAYIHLTKEGFLILPYLKKAWTDYCKAILAEAQWYHNKYTPTLEEYLNVSCVSISVPAILTHAYFLTTSGITEDALKHLETCQNVVRCSSMLLRLADDLGTSSVELKRGDVPKSIQCYMHETGASEEEARAYVKNLIWETWKKLNKELAAVDSTFSQTFNECAANLGRMAQFTYQYEVDEFGSPDALTKSCALSLLFTPKT